ncbi:MAG: hypothetical protein ACRDKE_06520 [Solirubrobacterales bacterium]
MGVRIAYTVRDGAQLLVNYREALDKAASETGDGQGSYQPWPHNLFDYLTRRLPQEYEFKYYLLDAGAARRLRRGWQTDAQPVTSAGSQRADR